jgi:hypothetical protein
MLHHVHCSLQPPHWSTVTTQPVSRSTSAHMRGNDCSDCTPPQSFRLDPADFRMRCTRSHCAFLTHHSLRWLSSATFHCTVTELAHHIPPPIAEATLPLPLWTLPISVVRLANAARRRVQAEPSITHAFAESDAPAAFGA